MQAESSSSMQAASSSMQASSGSVDASSASASSSSSSSGSEASSGSGSGSSSGSGSGSAYAADESYQHDMPSDSVKRLHPEHTEYAGFRPFSITIFLLRFER